MSERFRKPLFHLMLMFVPILLLAGGLHFARSTEAVAALESLPEAELQNTLTATVQIHAPRNGAYITEQSGTVRVISGYAWNVYDPAPFPAVPVLDPIENFEGGGTYTVNWSAVADATNYVLEEADNPQFTDPMLYAVSGTSQFIAGKDVGSYYYRVRAYNAAGRPSRFSDVEAVTVTQASLAGFSLPGTNLLAGEVSPQNTLMATPTMTVEVRINSGAWYPATMTDEGDYWSWSYDWTLPQGEEEPYTIEARGRVEGGEWSEIDTITIILDNNIHIVYLPLVFRRWPPVPYPPTLHAINNADMDGNYTVSWTYDDQPGVPTPTSYQLQEATNPNFTSPALYTGSGISRSFTDKPNATYYYRIRGVNAYGPGEWSNVRSVVVSVGFYDNFSNPASGWPHQVHYPHDNVNFMYADYFGNTYRMKVLREDAGRNNQKMGIIKAPYTTAHTNYDVYAEHFFTRAGDAAVDPAQGKAGLIFAANGDFSTIYVIEWNFEGHCAVARYRNASVPVSSFRTGSNLIHEPLKNWHNCAPYGVRSGYDQLNRFRVEVRNTTVSVFAYDSGGTQRLIHQFSEGSLGSYRRTGLLTGAWEWTPVESRFDNYRVEPK